MKIYVASSWRNYFQPGIVNILRKCGHEVYDFRHPHSLEPELGGFSWSDIDDKWKSWDPKEYREALKNPIAKKGYDLDIHALSSCDACVLVLPCGRSANWELGYAMGQGKQGYVVMFESAEPELMYREATILTSANEIFDAFDVRL
jgi:hypothetical protein